MVTFLHNFSIIPYYISNRFFVCKILDITYWRFTKTCEDSCYLITKTIFCFSKWTSLLNYLPSFQMWLIAKLDYCKINNINCLVTLCWHITCSYYMLICFFKKVSVISFSICQMSRERLILIFWHHLQNQLFFVKNLFWFIFWGLFKKLSYEAKCYLILKVIGINQFNNLAVAWG